MEEWTNKIFKKKKKRKLCIYASCAVKVSEMMTIFILPESSVDTKKVLGCVHILLEMFQHEVII